MDMIGTTTENNIIFMPCKWAIKSTLGLRSEVGYRPPNIVNLPPNNAHMCANQTTPRATVVMQQIHTCTQIYAGRVAKHSWACESA